MSLISSSSDPPPVLQPALYLNTGGKRDTAGLATAATLHMGRMNYESYLTEERVKGLSRVNMETGVGMAKAMGRGEEAM